MNKNNDASQATPDDATKTEQNEAADEFYSDSSEKDEGSQTSTEGDKSQDGESQPDDDGKETDENDKAADDDSKKEEGEDKDKDDEEAEVVYDLKKPEGSLLNDERVADLTEFAKANKFTPEQAQTLLEREDNAVSEFFTRRQEEYQQLQNTWVEEIKNDKELGGDNYAATAEAANRFAKHYGTPKLLEALNESGYGNHPELVRMFSKAYKDFMSEDRILRGNEHGGQEVPVEDLFYPPTQQ